MCDRYENNGDNVQLFYVNSLLGKFNHPFLRSLSLSFSFTLISLVRTQDKLLLKQFFPIHYFLFFFKSKKWKTSNYCSIAQDLESM